MRYFDPFDPKHMTGLKDAMSWSSRQLDPHREYREQLVRDYATIAYNTELKNKDISEKGGEYKTMFNAWQMAVDLSLLKLAGGTPQVNLYTAYEELLPFAAEFETVVNAEFKKLQFGSTFREWVKEAMFGLGVLKVCYREPEFDEMLPGASSESMSVRCEVIDLDNFVADFRAKNWDRCDFIGDRYRIEYREAKESELFIEESRSKLAPSRQSSYQDDAVGNYMSTMYQTWAWDRDELNEYVDIWDVYLPKAKIVVTFASGQEAVGPLRVKEWEGPIFGPYHILSFSKVPGHLMPLTPGHVIKPLHDLFNSLLRKLEQQARDQKTVIAVNSGQEDDGKKIEEAVNGSIISVQDTAGIKELNFNGPNSQNMALAPAVYDWLSRAAGNLDSMGGLGPQSNTVGQDQLISGAVSERIASMAEMVIESVTNVAKHIGSMIWDDQENSYFVHREIEGTGITIPVNMIPYDREGHFLDYNFSIVPHSISYVAPMQRAQTMLGILGQVVLPAAQFMAQQGINVRWQRVLETLAKYHSMPELNNLFEYGVPQEIGSGAGGIRKPSTSSRTYHRISSSARNNSASAILSQTSGEDSGGSVVGGG